jgi:hypothetical protein
MYFVQYGDKTGISCFAFASPSMAAAFINSRRPSDTYCQAVTYDRAKRLAQVQYDGSIGVPIFGTVDFVDFSMEVIG